ncbi:Methylase involved in ubiquinone/menaquinone biosynthesis [Pyrobaculum sp. WP30]|nr:Methylase involved in ubiquinone/menaquinone biosynthesis [Pyrobaculum sp. WP30]
MESAHYKSVVLMDLVVQDIKKTVGAVRLLFLPLLGFDVSCEILDVISKNKTVNYKTDRYAVVVGNGVGKLSEFRVPCVLDERRMPPLRRYIDLGLLRADFKRGPNYSILEAFFGNIAVMYNSLKWCSGDVYDIAKCAKMSESKAKEALAFLRTLYPSLFELHRNLPFSEKLGDVGRLLRNEDYWADLYYYIETGFITPNEFLIKPSFYSQDAIILRKVRGFVARYSIPQLLHLVDFRDAVVADIGCGYGTKGAFGIRHGARHVVLLDIDEKVLRERGNGLLIDKVVADAHALPIRDKAIDVSIFWNVLPFLKDEEKVLNEVKRISRREVAVSVYNAVSAFRRYSYADFLEIVLRLGKPKAIRKIGRNQFQAVVRYAHQNT